MTACCAFMPGKPALLFEEAIMFNSCISPACLALAFLLPTAALAQDSPVTTINAATAKADVTVKSLRGHISVLTGAGGNIVVLDSPQGKFMVDAGIGVSKNKLMAALKNIGPSPLRFLVNTHWHWDHTDGNTWMHDAGATIIAHGNTLKHLARSERVEYWNYTFQPLPAGGLPTVLLKADKTMQFGGETVNIITLKDGHTDGDLVVYFAKADVLVLGDNFWNGYYPFIDNGKGGGNVDTMIRSVDTALKMATDKTLIVPGHGPTGNRAQLKAYRDMLVAITANVRQLKKAGKTLDEVIAAKPTAAYDKQFDGFVIKPALFTRIVYEGLK
jgi:glyoxylase-like metal-dependent hydrolase (beta-lactamase superfamily II)